MCIITQAMAAIMQTIRNTDEVYTQIVTGAYALCNSTMQGYVSTICRL